MGTYLDKTGLQKVWEKVKAHDTSTLTAAKNYTNELQTKLTDGSITVNKATGATNATNAEKATKDSAGNTIITYYATKASFDELKSVIDTLINNAPEAYDTLKEIADYIASDSTGTTAMLASISTLQGYFNANGEAKSASEAKKAYQDSNGDNIVNTYATKTELSNLEETLQNSAESYTDDCISTLEETYLPANYAPKTHTHNYAGSSSAGGAANKVSNKFIIKLNSGTTEGTNLFTFDGSAAKTINLTASLIGAAAKNHTHDGYVQINDSNEIILPAGGIVYYNPDINTTGQYAGFCVSPTGEPVVISKDLSLCFTRTNDYVMYEYEFIFPSKNGTVALISDLPTALTEDDINEVCV